MKAVFFRKETSHRGLHFVFGFGPGGISQVCLACFNLLRVKLMPDSSPRNREKSHTNRKPPDEKKTNNLERSGRFCVSSKEPCSYTEKKISHKSNNGRRVCVRSISPNLQISSYLWRGKRENIMLDHGFLVASTVEN